MHRTLWLVYLKEEERGIKDNSWVFKMVSMTRLICSAYMWAPILMSNVSDDRRLVKNGSESHGLGWMGSEGDLQGPCLPNKRQWSRVVVFYLTAMSCIRLSFKLTLLSPQRRCQAYSWTFHTLAINHLFTYKNPTCIPLTQRYKSQGPRHTKYES